MPDKYFDVNGIATLVHHRGETTLPGLAPPLLIGRPILLLHDAGTTGNSFSSLMNILSEQHSPFSLDLPGHGRSGSLDSLQTVEEMAAHVATMMAEWEFDSLAVVGEGLGAAVGLELARNPSLGIEHLICLGAVGRTLDLSPEIEQLTLITTGKARRQFDASGYKPEPDQMIMKQAFAEWVKTDPRATLGARRAQEQWNRSTNLEGLDCPTLVVVGEHTESTFDIAANELISELPSAERVDLPEAGRRGAIETPEAVANLIDRFTQSGVNN